MKSLFPGRKPFDPSKWPFFYGYWIVVCTTIGIIFSAPGQTMGVSVFTDHLIESLQIDRLTLSTAYMIGTIISSFFITWAGRTIDGIGIRPVAAAASLSLGLALFYMSRVDSIAQAINSFGGGGINGIAAFAVVTFGFIFLRFSGQGVLTLASKTMLMEWFVHRRGRMNGYSGVVVSLVFASSPLIFEQLIQNYTWRGAWVVLGSVISIGLTIFVLIFFRDKPENSNLIPDGRKFEDEENNINNSEADYTLSEARKTYVFWIFNLGLSMFSLVLTAILFHIVSIFQVNGLPRETAISIFLPASIIAVSLHFIVGWLSDFTRLKYYLFIILLGIFLSCTGVFFLNYKIGFYLIIAGNGIASGMFSTLSTVTWPRFFGRTHLGAVSGFNMSFLVFFSAIGPFIFGWSYTISDNYRLAAGFCMGIILILMIGSYWADKPDLKSSES